MVEIELVIHNEGEKVSEAVFKRAFGRFKEVLEEVLESYLSGQPGVVNLVLVGDAKIQEINREYRGKDMPTDVISFAYLEQGEFIAEAREVAAGDIFISIDTAKKQATEKGHSLEREMEILFVHGLLHLFGFDHNNDSEEEEMESWAERILS